MGKYLKIGPWGGTSGDPRGFTADDQTGISYIEIFLGVVIDSITFKWGDEQNQQKNSYKIGGDGGHSVAKVYTTTALMKLTQLQSRIFLKLRN